MDPSSAAGSLVLPGALVVAGFGSVIGVVAYLFRRLFNAMDAQISDLKARVQRGEDRFDKQTERHIQALEGAIFANTKALSLAEASAEDRFNHLMARFSEVLETVKETRE
jgi:hypothetical protein